MKRSLFLVITVTVIIFIACSSELRFSYELNKMVTIMRGKQDTELTSEQFLKEISDSKVIFVGEIHSDSLTHVFEYELLKNIYAKHNKIAVALEMFERDVQVDLNKYLDGEISEEEFMEKSRPWDNYTSAYKPLVDFAKENQLPVLAMNVPRRYANKVAMQGEKVLDKIPDSETEWIARKLEYPDGSYKKRFTAQMGGEKRPGPMGKFNSENLYKAQCLKDDTMAESISDFLKKNPGYKVIAFQGSFHVAYGLGLAKKLHMSKPDIDQKVAICIPVDDLSSFNFDKHRDRGDYLVFIYKTK
ncbi:MAG: ChaN family lipoprotein [bacterium]